MRRLFYFLLIVLLVFLSKSYLGKAYMVPAASMKPALHVGDHFFVKMGFYKDNPIQRGDIIVFMWPKDNKTEFVKRVVGLPNEKLQIKDGVVYIDENIIEEPYVIIEGSAPGREKEYGPIIVPADSVFVLGDNRNNSYDSRFWGPVPINNILGKANRIYWAKDKGRIWKKIQ